MALAKPSRPYLPRGGMGAMVWLSDHLHYLQVEGVIDGSGVLHSAGFVGRIIPIEVSTVMGSDALIRRRRRLAWPV